MPDDTEPMAFLECLEALFPDAVRTGTVRGVLTCWLEWGGDEDPGPGDETWGISPGFWADNGEEITTHPRPCPHCHVVMPGGIDDLPDACLGTLPNVSNACCGHGGADVPYVALKSSGKVLRGPEALEWFARKGVGPKSSLVLELELYREKYGPLP